MKRLGPVQGAALRIATTLPGSRPPRRAATPLAPTAVHVLRGCLTAALLAVCLTCALFFPAIVARQNLQVGDVAPSTMLAPGNFTINDTAATNARRAAAAAAVPSQFRTSTVAQQQSESLAAAVLSAVTGLKGRGQT